MIEGDFCLQTKLDCLPKAFSTVLLSRNRQASQITLKMVSLRNISTTFSVVLRFFLSNTVIFLSLFTGSLFVLFSFFLSFFLFFLSFLSFLFFLFFLFFLSFLSFFLSFFSFLKFILVLLVRHRHKCHR